MKRALAVAAVALSLLGIGAVADASTIFHANMTFDQEVPTVPAFEGTSGVAPFVLSDAQDARMATCGWFRSCRKSLPSIRMSSKV